MPTRDNSTKQIDPDILARGFDETDGSYNYCVPSVAVKSKWSIILSLLRAAWSVLTTRQATRMGTVPPRPGSSSERRDPGRKVH